MAVIWAPLASVVLGFVDRVGLQEGRVLWREDKTVTVVGGVVVVIADILHKALVPRWRCLESSSAPGALC